MSSRETWSCDYREAWRKREPGFEAGQPCRSKLSKGHWNDDILLPRQPEALHSFKYKMQGSPLHMESLLLTLLCRSLKLSIRKEGKNGSAIVAVQCDEPLFHAPPKPRSYIVQRRSTLSPPAQVVSHSLQVSFQEEFKMAAQTARWAKPVFTWKLK